MAGKKIHAPHPPFIFITFSFSSFLIDTGFKIRLDPKKRPDPMIRPLVFNLFREQRALVGVLFVEGFHDFLGGFRDVRTGAEDGHGSVFSEEVVVLGGNDAAAEDHDVRTPLFLEFFHQGGQKHLVARH